MRTIEAVFKEVVGAAPDPRSVDKMMRAGRVMKLRDDDAFWLIIVVLEAQYAAVAKSLAEAKTLADAAKAAGDDARRGADLIKKIVVDGGPWLEKTVQDSALGVSGELSGAIKDAAVRASKGIVDATQQVATGACSDLKSELAAAGALAVEKIKEAAKNAVFSLNWAKTNLQNEAELAGDATVRRWAEAVDRAVEARIADKSATERATQRRRTILTIAVTLLVTLALFLGLWFLAQSSGYSEGYAAGVQSSFDAKERSAWANTKEGKDAYWLAQTGTLSKLTNCVNRGWVVEKRDRARLCFPKAASDGDIMGWVLPP